VDVRSVIFKLSAPICRHSALLLCHRLTHLQIVGGFWCRKHVLPNETKRRYKLLCRTKFPVSFTVPIILSHE
jgi:hypothetical protein